MADSPLGASSATETTGVVNKLTQPLYDTSEFDDSVLRIDFFVRPIGQSLPISGAAKTICETNMRQAGTIPAGESYQVRGVKLLVQEAFGDGTDTPELLMAVFQGSVLVFEKQQKVMLQVPTVMCNPGCGISYAAAIPAAGTMTSYGQLGSPDARSFWMLDNPIVLGSNEPFAVYIILPALLASLAAEHKITCILDAVEIRPIN